MWLNCAVRSVKIGNRSGFLPASGPLIFYRIFLNRLPFLFAAGWKNSSENSASKTAVKVDLYLFGHSCSKRDFRFILTCDVDI